MDPSGWHFRNLVLRLLEALLNLYPPRFRREFSSEMHDIVLSRVRAAEQLGRRAWLAVVFQEIVGLVPSILQESWHELRLQKESVLVPEPYFLKHRYTKTIAYLRWADPPLWLAILSDLLPLWLITIVFTTRSEALGITAFILIIPATIVLLWLGWFTPELILYSLSPLISLFLFEEMAAPYEIAFRLLCSVILTAGIVGYRISLHKDSISLGWLTLLVVFIGTWMLAAHANQNYWQMGQETPWWVIFFSP